METSVFMSNGNVKIVVGKASASRLDIKKMMNLVLPEGCLINGIITNDLVLSSALRDFWTANKLSKSGVKLTVESTQFISKRLTVPDVARAKINSIIKNEYAGQISFDDPLYDYAILDRLTDTKKVNIISTAVSKSFINQYLTLFREAGISLKSITTAQQSAIAFFNNSVRERVHSVINLILDGNNCSSYMMLRGSYRHSNSSRVFSSEGTSDFSDEIVRIVGGMLKFHSSEKMEYPIESVCLSGFDPRYATDVANTIYGVLNLPCAVLDVRGNIRMKGEAGAQGTVSEAVGMVYPAGNLYNESLNFKKRFSESEDLLTPKIRSIIKYSSPIVALLIVCMITTAIVLSIRTDKLTELNIIKNYLNNEENIKKSAEYDRYELMLADIRRNNQAAEYHNSALGSYPLPSSEIIDNLSDLGLLNNVTISVSSYSSESGTISFTATSVDVENIYRFIRSLASSELFSARNYSGYKLDDKSGTYDIDVVCMLSQAAGREVK